MLELYYIKAENNRGGLNRGLHDHDVLRRIEAKDGTNVSNTLNQYVLLRTHSSSEIRPCLNINSTIEEILMFRIRLPHVSCLLVCYGNPRSSNKTKTNCTNSVAEDRVTDAE